VSDPAIMAAVEPTRKNVTFRGKYDPDEVPLAKKQSVCMELERSAMAAGQGKIVNSIVSYGDGIKEQWIVNTAGTAVYYTLPRCKVNCQLTAMEGEVRQQNFQVVGRQAGPEVLLDVKPEELSVKAAKKVLQQLRAKKAPAAGFSRMRRWGTMRRPTRSGRGSRFYRGRWASRWRAAW
jgi:predicted Zn-dependent protease